MDVLGKHKFSDFIGKGTGGIQACSIVPRPATLLRANCLLSENNFTGISSIVRNV
jgi:hypothetical protein